MFNIMTDRWLQRRLRSPWRSTKTMGEKKRPQPGTNHGQMLLVCGVREWRQTGLAPQHTARTRTHAPGNNITRRTARQARARGNAQHGRVALAVLPQPTSADWNRTDGGDNIPGIDARPTDGRTDRQTDQPTMIIIISNVWQTRTFVSYRRAAASLTNTRCSDMPLLPLCQYHTITSTTTDRSKKEITSSVLSVWRRQQKLYTKLSFLLISICTSNFRIFVRKHVLRKKL